MQALLITAYKNSEQLYNSLKILSENFNCYVHIDKNSDLNNANYLMKLNSLNNVTAISKYKINWGSFYHMIAVIELMRMAYSDIENSYFHIISGEDFPIKKYEVFVDYFENNTRNYIELTDITEMPVMKLRYEKYHFLHVLNRKSKYKIIVLIDKIIRQAQYHIPFKRNINYDYKGLLWCSINRMAVNSIINMTDKKEIRKLKYCEIAEEFFIQNCLMKNHEQTVVKDNLRYMSWTKGNKASPGYLDITDYEEIKKTDDFFARKVTMSGNKEQVDLYKKLEQDYVSNIART